MAHRGPDSQGVWTADGVGLCFRRLAIIDLDPRSNQPLHHDGLHLVFNGEIYNYRELRSELQASGHAFVTEGDGEVLIHAWREWGEAALARVNGMFAMAVWNEHDGSLTLASDPFGEKPLYYSIAGAVGVRLRHPRTHRGRRRPRRPGRGGRTGLCRPRPDAGPEPSSRASSAFPPLICALAGGTRNRHALLDSDPGRRARALRSAVDALRELLTDSIRLRLRSDVPVGTSLSGGVDSSAVAALCARLGADARRHAFTATFPGYERDEWPYAEEVARAAEVLEHHRAQPTADALGDDLEALVRSQEEPFGSTSIYAQWCVNRAARDAGIVVLLDGQGADELFGGYRRVVGPALGAPVVPAPPSVFLRLAPAWQASSRPPLSGPGPREHSNELFGSVGSRPIWSGSWPALQCLTCCRPSTGIRVGLRCATSSSEKHSIPAFRTSCATPIATAWLTLSRFACRTSTAESRSSRCRCRSSGSTAAASGNGRSARPCAGSSRTRFLIAVTRSGSSLPQARWLNSPAAMARLAELMLDPSVRSAGRYDAGAFERDVCVVARRDDQWSARGDVELVVRSVVLRFHADDRLVPSDRRLLIALGRG